MDLSGIDASYLQYMNQANANQATQKLEQSLKGDYAAASDDELMEVCKQFESYFLEQVFKEMMKTIPESEDSDSANGRLVDYFKDSAIQELASQSTETNGLGLAQTMYEQMKRNVAAQIPTAPPEETAPAEGTK